jgi:adenylate cyclase
MAPNEPYRPSQAAGSSSRVPSSSNSFGSMSQTAQGEIQEQPQAYRYSPSMSDGMISPLHEIPEPEFTLDMNLDDMEGIVDHNLANAPSTTAAPTRQGTLANVPESGSGSGSGWALQDALQGTAHRSEGSSGSASSSQPSGRDILRESVANPFTKQNPFAARSSNGSDDIKSLPASPHTYSPKHSLPPASQPRRPSQLRNVKMGSIDSQASSSSQGRSLQPIWSTDGSQPTLFNDPFKPSMPTVATPPRERNDSTDAGPTPQPNTDSGLLAPAIVGSGPAWAAPESWGVEGDEEDPNDASSSSSVEGEKEWTVGESPSSPGANIERRLSLMLPSLDSKSPPPFGFKSKPGYHGNDRPGSSSRGSRAKTRDGRPSTSARNPASNRPGTSGSAQLAAVPVCPFFFA